jgi:hypothetical protein
MRDSVFALHLFHFQLLSLFSLGCFSLVRTLREILKPVHGLNFVCLPADFLHHLLALFLVEYWISLVLEMSVVFLPVS